MAGSNLITGTLDLLILQTLKWGPKHGYAIIAWINEQTDGAFELSEGVVYPALHRLNKKGWVRGKWGESDSGRRARFYTLTDRGWKALQRETALWEEQTAAVAALLRHTGG
ncbi:MAG: PadR family transcriptional regulator [Longimicrobiales bacterium]